MGRSSIIFIAVSYDDLVAVYDALTFALDISKSGRTGFQRKGVAERFPLTCAHIGKYFKAVPKSSESTKEMQMRRRDDMEREKPGSRSGILPRR